MKKTDKKSAILIAGPNQSKTNYFLADTLLIFAGFLVAGLSTLIKMYLPDVGSSLIFGICAVFLTLVAWGGAGLVWAIKREVYQFIFRITGIPAVLIGLSVCIVCWGFAIYILFRNISNL